MGIDQLRRRIESSAVSTSVHDEKKLEKVTGKAIANGTTIPNGSNGHITKPTTSSSTTSTLPFLLLQVSMLQTMAGPIGFSALRHISYPTMVLGKVSP